MNWLCRLNWHSWKLIYRMKIRPKIVGVDQVTAYPIWDFQSACPGVHVGHRCRRCGKEVRL
jgi:ABC-type hemin transport system substrate-binding protein